MEHLFFWAAIYRKRSWNFRLNYLKKKKTLLGSIQESLQNLGQHSQQNNKLFEIQIALILGMGFSSFIFYVEHIN